MLILREYKDCYDALVDALERGGSLGDCIYAIENTARKNDRQPLKQPLGYIVETSDGKETWETEFSLGNSVKTGTGVMQSATTDLPLKHKSEKAIPPPSKRVDGDMALDQLRNLKKTAQDKLNDLESKLEDLD